MFEMVLNTPPVVIGNIIVQNVLLLLLDRYICFWPVENMFPGAALERSPTK